jgi:hypothetical protein
MAASANHGRLTQAETGKTRNTVLNLASRAQRIAWPTASGRPLDGLVLSRLAVLKHERLSASAGTARPAPVIGYRHQGPAVPAIPAPHTVVPCTATACQARNALRMDTYLTPEHRIASHPHARAHAHAHAGFTLNIYPTPSWAPAAPRPICFKADSSPVMDCPHHLQ